MPRIDVLIAGAGLAGARCAETLRANGFTGSVVLAGEEPFAPYERPALSKEVLTKGRDIAEVSLRPDASWPERDIGLRLDAPVRDVDPEFRTALVGDERVHWRRLVVATGARARRLGCVPDVDGVHHLRTLGEARRLRERLRPGTRLALIGAGFIGVELASSARELGAEVDVIEMEDLPFGRLLGSEVGRRVAARMRAAGVRMHMGAAVEGAAAGGDRIAGVRLGGDVLVPCDELVVGVGARPNTELLGGRLPLADDGGILTDAAGRTEHPDVYACGDVASAWRPDLGRHARFEHWSSATAGARAVAAAITGRDIPDHGVPYFWSDQFGWRLQLVGHPMGVPRLVEDAGPDGFIVRYEDGAGGLRGGLAVNRPDALAGLRAEVAETTREAAAA
ncbi:MAG: FAD-dependent oxidoreductase [Thermoleophilia bacterium]